MVYYLLGSSALAGQVLAAHEAAVQVVCLNTSGTVLFSGDALGTILIWAKSESGKGESAPPQR